MSAAVPFPQQSAAHRPAPPMQADTVCTALAVAILLSGVALCLQPALFPTDRQRQRTAIRIAVQERRPESLAPAQRYLENHPDDVLVRALAAKAAADQSLHELAIDLYQTLPHDRGRWEFIAALGLARKHEHLGRLAEAERHLRRALQLDPYSLEANERLGHLLQVEGRVWESGPFFYTQLLQGKCRGDELLGMAGTERFFRGDEQIEIKDRETGESEILLKLGLARRLIYDNREAEAEQILQRVVAARPDLGEAQGRLGRMIVDRGEFDQFLKWFHGMPDVARNHPEVWYCQGLQARQLGQLDGAVGCFLQALERSPNHLQANLQMANCLERLGETRAAQGFSRRAELLAELDAHLNLVRGNPDPNLIAKVVSVMEKMGRFWEAAGWCQVMSRLHLATEEPARERSRWLHFCSTTEGPNALSYLPIRQLTDRQFPQPYWPAPTGQGPNRSTDPAAEPQWSFVEEASQRGITFEYEEGTSEDNRLSHIFNVVGGGLAALDFDGDGWPDLYIAQANHWRDPSAHPDLIDRLFHNQQGDRFVDITQASGLQEHGFSHGVTVADFDQDGFPDIYVGNKGPNRLFRNQGDGTFQDITDLAGVAGNEWTTSSVFADFNADGLPDLYVLNYSHLDETAKKECRRSNGDIVACTPDLLIPEADRCYVNLGDGRFRDVSEIAGIALPQGKGLGVIAWDFTGEGRLSLFVANDTTQNFLFVNSGTNAEGIPQFQDEGVVRGVGFNVEGNAQASMGVAAGDANGDGRIDLYITTFFADTKTLYSQRPDHFFDDMTRNYDLRDPGFWLLGFGCQFADLDGDGWNDLVITNGHVDQKSVRGDPDRMSPQILRNLRGKRFVEVPAANLGPFFQGHYLGRGLAVFDWNRDGRTDVGISHIHGPFALVTNHTPEFGSPLVVRLIGRSGCREPTGALLTLKCGNLVQTRLQTAGDGYLVTNEHRHHFAIPATTDAVELEVRWPGGVTEVWHHLPGNSEILLIEGRQDPVLLRGFSEAGAAAGRPQTAQTTNSNCP
ncbi:MAG: VCBS repeat-containing protein [Planctomycetes bacterium]|nr:VCBS repeat-containing protein [Planctomycetota bacterium]